MPIRKCIGSPTAPLLLVGLVLLLGACNGSAGRLPPPVMPDVFPTALPTLDIPSDADGPTVVVGDDELLYIVGAPDTAVGEAFVIRYGGEWLDELGERPNLALLRAMRTWPGSGGAVVLVQPEYVLTGVDLVGAKAEKWTSEASPEVGKGLATITSVDDDKAELSLGFSSGLQPGDQFVVVTPGGQGKRLGERTTGVVVVDEVKSNAAMGTITRSGGLGVDVDEGQWAIFVGPGVPKTPHEAKILVSGIDGGAASLKKRLVAVLEEHITNVGNLYANVETIDTEVDPLAPSYGFRSAGLEYDDRPRLLVSGKVVQQDGRKHLVLNYANTGLTVAHGMIAATPEGGIDVGPASHLSPDTAYGALVNVVAALLTHRNQLAEAIYVLEVALATGGWDGPARWHARDQLAMRWAQAGNDRAALRIVREDVARGEATEDPSAVINAVGTLMPLYENLGDLDKSLAEAERFYRLRAKLGDGVYADHARRSWIEMLYKTGKLDQATSERESFISACDELEPAREKYLASGEVDPALFGTCVSDVYYLNLSGYWSSKPGSERRQRFLANATELAELLGTTNLASVRLIQGMQSIGEGDFDGAQIAFLEARRLFSEDNYPPGLGRVDSLGFNLSMAAGERQQAFELAMSSADVYARSHDVHELASVYRMLTRLYVDVPPRDRSIASYVRAAPATMAEALKLQLALGDLASAAEVFYVSGRFLLPTDPGEAGKFLRRASDTAIKTVRFDIAALAQIGLGAAARAQGDNIAFDHHLTRAKDLARLSGDTALLQSIIRVESGEFEERPTL